MSDDPIKKSSDGEPHALTASDSSIPPVSSQTLPVAAQQLPFPSMLSSMPGHMMSLSVTNAEAEAIKKVTAEHISQELSNRHAREMRKYELEERELDHEDAEAGRELQRDQRDREGLEKSDQRLERMFYVIIGVVMSLALTLIYKDRVDDAIKAVGLFISVIVLLLGGVGVEKLRQDRKQRRRAPSGGKDER